MKIKDYNDAIEFFRTNDYKAADGAWSEFYQSEVLEPRITDLADGGRIGFEDGNDVDVPKWKRTTNYKKTQEAKKKGLVWNKYTKTMDKPKRGPSSGKTPLTNTEKFHRYVAKKKAADPNWVRPDQIRPPRILPKQEGMTWDKKTKSFRPRKIFTETMSAAQRKAKFTAKEKIKKSKEKTSKKIKDFVEKFKLDNNGKLPSVTEIMNEGFIHKNIHEYLEKGVDFTAKTKQEAGKLGGKQFGDLDPKAQQAIKYHFHDVDIDFSKNADGTYKKGKYGIEAGGRGESKALYEQIRRFVANPSEWKYAYNLGAADGWLLSQMDRAGYERIWEDIDGKGNMKIIGHIDPDGNKYYGAKKWADKYDGLQVATSHPDYGETKRLVDITKKTRTLPNQAIQDILTKGGVPIDSKLQLNHLLNYLIDKKGVDVTRSALEKHHVRGVKHTPTKDLQLVTRIANAKARAIRTEIDSGVFDKIDVDDRLKKLGITLTDNKTGERYGGKGFESIEEVESFTEKGLKKELKADPNLKGLREALVRSGIPCRKGEGGKCTSVADYKKGYNQIVEEAADGSKDAIQKLGKFTKLMRGATGAAKWTGYGLLAEIGFMVPFAIGDYAAGESWKRILGNATDYGFGPILGQSEQEEFEAALPEGSAAPQRRKVYELGERLDRMENQKVNPGYGRVGYRQKAEDARQNVYDSILDEYILNMQPFLRTSPHLEESRYYDQYLMDKAEQEDIATMEKLEAERQARIDERTERGIIADQNWQSQIAPRYAQGGIASLKRK